MNLEEEKKQLCLELSKICETWAQDYLPFMKEGDSLKWLTFTRISEILKSNMVVDTIEHFLVEAYENACFYASRNTCFIACVESYKSTFSLMNQHNLEFFKEHEENVFTSIPNISY